MIQKNREPVFKRALFVAMGIVGGLTICGMAQAQSSNAQGSGGPEHTAPQLSDAPAQANALSGTPILNPNWRPPAVPPGSVAAEEIGSLESQRDHEIDYPREARIARREGTTTIGFTIDTDGRVVDCLIVKSSGDAYLDTGSCALILARGLYKPAYDSNGSPLASGRTLQISWQLGWDVPRLPAESFIRLSFTIHEDGSFTNCWLDRGDGTQGVSHPEMCVGSWPAPLLALMHEIAGPGDMQVQSISGLALSEGAMATQMTEPTGWQRFISSAAWHAIDESGKAVSCVNEAFPGVTEVQNDAPCRPSSRHFMSPVAVDGKATTTRIGINSASYVKLPEHQ